MNTEKTLVSICCVTYNHEKFIRQCLDGFVMQKTNFKYEVLVHDDASTDATAKIVEDYQNKYPQLFRCVYQKENQFYKQNTLVDILFKMSKGKYIAMCEGDDYWIDPYKLQKQVDVLEKNQNISLVYSNAKIDSDEKGDYINDPLFFSGDYPKDPIKKQAFFLNNNYAILTLSVMFRSEFFGVEDKIAMKKFATGDLPIYIILSSKGDFYYINEEMVVYNDHGGGISKTFNKIKRNLINYSNMYLLLPYIQKENKKMFNYFQHRYLIQPAYEIMIILLRRGKLQDINFSQFFFVKLKHLKLKYIYYTLKMIYLKIKNS